MLSGTFDKLIYINVDNNILMLLIHVGVNAPGTLNKTAFLFENKSCVLIDVIYLEFI